MNKNILQSVIFKDELCESSLLYQNQGVFFAEEQASLMEAGSILSTYSYMNLFDAKTWNRYTGLTDFCLEIEYKGNGSLLFYKADQSGEGIHQIKELELTGKSRKKIYIDFNIKEGEIFWFDINAESNFYIYSALYKINRNAQRIREPEIALIICTYKGKKYLARNFKKLKKSSFFDKENNLYGKLNIYIADNDSMLPLTNTDKIKIVHNPNTGGTGGFMRGLSELRNDVKKYKKNISHVIFMDDDVDIMCETLYRLYSLLSFVKEEYVNVPISGRMLCSEERCIQYSAAEIWQKGYVRHVGTMLDLSKAESLANINDEKNGEYGGWWFSCVPYDFAKENDPYPFFLHCDDVEYGIRLGGRVIILNGIHVWHDTPENKESPIIAYYDTRNTLIVNSIYDFDTESEALELWKNRIAAYADARDVESIVMVCLGLIHFIRGADWFLNADTALLHKSLVSGTHPLIPLIKGLCKISYKLAWRSIYVPAKSMMKQTRAGYRRLKNEYKVKNI